MKGNINNDVKNNLSKSKITIGIVVLFIFVAILLFFLLNGKAQYEVSFDSNGGSTVASIIVDKNGLAIKPEDPTKENYVFAGWYHNDELFDFSKPITENIKLEARWVEIGRVAGVEIDQKDLTLKTGDKVKLNAIITPEDALDKTVTWESSDDSVVSVDEEGNVEALKEGVATITVTTKDGEFTAKVEINVSKEEEKEDSNKEIENKPTKPENKPTEPEVKPEEKPTEPEDKPVEPENKPTEPEEKPVEPENKPTEPEDKPNTQPEEEEKPVVKEYTVKFDVDGKIIETKAVKENETVSKPSDPKKEGHEFKGWLLNGKIFDFSTKITGNITLKADWKTNDVVDYEVVTVSSIGTIEQVKIYVTLNGNRVAGTVDITYVGDVTERVNIPADGYFEVKSAYTNISNPKVK